MPNSSWAGNNMDGGMQLLVDVNGARGTARGSAAAQKWLGSAGPCTIVLRSGVVSAVPEGTRFKFDLMLTPVRPLDGEEWRRHFADRYYQYGYNGEDAPSKAAGFNTTIFDTH